MTGVRCKKCLNATKDDCLEWTGSSYPYFNIEQGKYYDTEIVKALNKIEEFQEQKIDVSCLNDGKCGNCEPLERIPESIIKIYKYLCAFTDENVGIEADLGCLEDGKAGEDVSFLTKVPFNYGINNEGVTYDITKLVDSLPKNYSLQSVDSIVYGTSKRGNSIIGRTSECISGVQVASDRYPIRMSINTTVNTPNGSIILTGVVSASCNKAYAGTDYFMIQDLRSNVKRDKTQKVVNELFAGEICKIRTTQQKYDHISVGRLQCTEFTDGALLSLVLQLVHKVDDLQCQLNKLNSITYSECSTGCEETIVTKDIHSFARDITSSNCKQQKQIDDLSKKCDTAIQTCSSGCSGTTGGTTNTNGTTNNGGTCTGGGCGGK